MMDKDHVEEIDYTNQKAELLNKLTKRNEQYIHDIDKALALANINEQKRAKIEHDMMLELIEGQKSGQTARQLFGTVSQKVKDILEGPKEALSKPSEDWKLFLDGALLMGSLFMLLSGISANGKPLGIITLLLNYVIAGFAMLLVTKSSAKIQKELKETKQRWKPMLKYMGMTMLAMGIWVVGIIVITLIPSEINPVLPQVWYLGIGGVTLALKFYVKKALHIRGGMI